MDERIVLVRPFMPPREEFEPYLDRIWHSAHLTNNGPILEEFTAAISRYLGAEHICLTANGTLALYFAIKSLHLEGEVITSPFTSVATLQAILLNGLKPAYADISAEDFNIEPGQAKEAIGEQTCAILPVHLFGNPCNTAAIAKIADAYGLKVVYDAAHGFGVTDHGRSLCQNGDRSAISLHATKVMNSVEGGVVVCPDCDSMEYVDSLKNVSQAPGQGAWSEGLNAKMNEFQAAFGLIQLRYLDQLIKKRQDIAHLYRTLASGIPGIGFLTEKPDVRYNYSFMPVLVDSAVFGADRDALAAYLDSRGVSTRKYFHPLLCDLPGQAVSAPTKFPVARTVASRILCLPLYPDLETGQVEYIVDCIRTLHKER